MTRSPLHSQALHSHVWDLIAHDLRKSYRCPDRHPDGVPTFDESNRSGVVGDYLSDFGKEPIRAALGLRTCGWSNARRGQVLRCWRWVAAQWLRLPVDYRVGLIVLAIIHLVFVAGAMIWLHHQN
jgi:hypothetical protein